MKYRPRRLRTTTAMRSLVADVSLAPSDLMLPIFVREGITAPRPIDGMPGVLQHSETSLIDLLDQAIDSGIKSVMLFAIPEVRDALGTQALDADGILNRVVRAAKAHVGSSLVIVADLCLDEFTDHGHCGVLDAQGEVDNDLTLDQYRSMALALAHSGADLLGTSGMMDGQVGAIRDALDSEGLTSVGILAYSAKYASSFYGPFRAAVESQLDGDRKTYQQDYRRQNEAIEEIELDLAEGADIVMVKPALAYLDIVAAAADRSTKPVAAYVVSGEYSLIELGGASGIIDRDAAIFEILYGLKRAGASIICTYWALEFAKRLKDNDD